MVRRVRVRFQYISTCPFCESARHIVEILRQSGVEVIEEMLDAPPYGESENVRIINTYLEKKGLDRIPASQWVPSIVLELYDDDSLMGKIVINIEEYVEINGRKYPCREPYTHVGELARQFIDDSRGTLLRNVEEELDNIFGTSWRVGYECMRRYEEIAMKILRIVHSWAMSRP